MMRIPPNLLGTSLTCACRQCITPEPRSNSNELEFWRHCAAKIACSEGQDLAEAIPSNSIITNPSGLKNKHKEDQVSKAPLRETSKEYLSYRRETLPIV